MNRLCGSSLDAVSLGARLILSGECDVIIAAGTEPSLMGGGPIYSTRKVMTRYGLTSNDFDLAEINEAFASQSIECVRQLKLDIDKVNVNGGAIALGHPLGASGTRILTTLICEMKRRNAKLGLASMCIGECRIRIPGSGVSSELGIFECRGSKQRFPIISQYTPN